MPQNALSNESRSERNLACQLPYFKQFCFKIMNKISISVSDLATHSVSLANPQKDIEEIQGTWGP